MTTGTATWSAERAAAACFRRAASPAVFGRAQRVWQEAGHCFKAEAQAVEQQRWNEASKAHTRAVQTLAAAGLKLSEAMPPAPAPAPAAAPAPPLPAPPAPAPDPVQVCSLRARTLRQNADKATTLQTERAVIEYGAAAALERAAQLWADGRDATARGWMAAAENVLAANLIPVPW